MRKHPVFLFFAVVAILIGSATAYIQSAAFANQLKRLMARYVPKNLGIAADFSNLSIQLFPPGVGVVNPTITVAPKNAANLPEGTSVQAERMELSFRPLQILSGRVSIHEVRIVNGSVKTALVPGAPEPKKKRGKLSWQDLFEIQAERVSLENTAVELALPTLKSRATFNAKSVEVEKVREGKATFYDVLVHLGELQADVPKSFPYPSSVDSLRMSARLGAQGLELKEFELVREGTQAIASGRVTGDLLQGSGLKADLSLKLNGDLGRMLRFLVKGDEGDVLPQGHIAFDGNAKMDLDRVPETLSASGVLNGENLSYRAWAFDKVELDGSYSAGKGGEAGEIALKRGLFESKEIDKRGGNRPGSGGKIEIAAFRYNLSAPAPIETNVKLTRAHLHWLGAELLEELYSLDGRVTGDTKVRFTPGTATAPFEVRAGVDWKVTGLQLDNQRLGKERKLSRLISLKEPTLTGSVSVTPARVKFEEMTVAIKASKLDVNGEIALGKGKTSYEIVGGGNIDFDELGILAENPISGAGALSARIHGPADRVVMDFDGSIRNFKYLNLDFGEFRGRVSWEDEPSTLHFRNLDCNRGRTRYTVNGAMDLSDTEHGDKMDIAATVAPGGNFSDFVGIFDFLVKDYWWFPRALSGWMKGSVRVHGGIALQRMMIDASVDGQRWEYYGERFERVALRGGYDKGRYFLSSFEGVKRQGRVFGSISYDARQNYDWKVDTENFSLSDVDHIAALDIPLRGAVSASSRGKGPVGAVESKTEARLTDVVLRGRRMADSSLLIETHGGRARIEGNGLGNQAILRAMYDFTPGHESMIEVKADGLDFSPLVLLLNPSLMQDDQLVGRVSGSAKIDFQSGRFEVGSGQAKISEYSLRKTGTDFHLDRPYELRIDRGSFTIPGLTLVGDEGSVTLAMRSSEGNLSGTLRGRMDLSVAEFVTSAIEKSDGVAELDLRIAGTAKAPIITGEGQVKRGSIRIRGLDTPIEDINGDFDLADGTLSLDGFDSDLASGRATLDGTLDFFLTKWPTMDLEIGLNGNKLKVFPFQVAKVRGKLEVQGKERPYQISGRVLVENAITREKIANARGPGLRAVQYMPQASTLASGTIPLFQLDIGVSAPGNVIVQNELMDLEAKGDLRIVGTLDNPRPLGTASAVQGKILFKDRVFTIQSGTMEFDNPTVINPRYEVLASTEVMNRRIQLFAAGRLDSRNPRIEFTSNPPMAESEILNLLALGVVGEDNRKFRSNDRSAYEQSEAASLVLHSLDFNREVESKTGFQIGIDEAVDERTGTSVFSRSTTTENAAAPKIVIRRQLGNRVGVSAASTVGVGSSIQREVNTEVRVTNGLSVIGVWDTIEGATAQEPKQSSFGVDLKLQKRFK
jgi:hypothetical protein